MALTNVSSFTRLTGKKRVLPGIVFIRSFNNITI